MLEINQSSVIDELVHIQNHKDLGLVVSSRVIAEGLGKRHADVLGSIDNILENGDFRSLCIPATYSVEGQKREYREYLLTKDGFTLYMFNIQGYNDFKLTYITILLKHLHYLNDVSIFLCQAM